MNKSKTSDSVVLLMLAIPVALYGIDAFRASTHVLNLIMVLPLTIIVLILCGVQLFLTVRRSDDEDLPREPARQVIPAMVLFSAYVLSLKWLGFDVGTFAFLAASLWLHGERRILRMLCFSAGFAGVVTFFFSKMLPYPMPMLLLNTAY